MYFVSSQFKPERPAAGLLTPPVPILQRLKEQLATLDRELEQHRLRERDNAAVVKA